MKDLYKLLGITGNPSTAYHPQTDGQTERVNQELEQYLRIYVNHHQNDWSEWLAIAEFQYNDQTHSTTGHTPFFLNYGQHPYKGSNVQVQTKTPGAEEFATTMTKIREEAIAAMNKASETMKRFYDCSRSDSIILEPGDKVWLEGTNIKSDRPSQKLDDKWYGPFEVLKKVGASSYELKLPRTWKKVHPVFNESLLSPYIEPAFGVQHKPRAPPTILVDDVEEYEVEEILNSRVYRRKFQYLVKWKGYSPIHNTWEPVENVQNADEAREEFHEKYPSKPKPSILLWMRTFILKKGVMSWTSDFVSFLSTYDIIL